MADDAHNFSWQPQQVQPRCFLCLAIPIVLVCGAIGFVLGKIDPLQSLITAIERNGVPIASPQQAKPAATRLSAPDPQVDVPPQSIRLAKTAAPASDPPPSQPETATRPRVMILNPGAADQPAHGVEESTDRASSERSDQDVVSAPSARDVPSRSQLAQPRGFDLDERSPRMQVLSAERNVLVIVRRAIPPYDTKILRGRIRDGRLIVHPHDRRGMTLRY